MRHILTLTIIVSCLITPSLCGFKFPVTKDKPVAKIKNENANPTGEENYLVKMINDKKAENEKKVQTDPNTIYIPQIDDFDPTDPDQIKTRGIMRGFFYGLQQDPANPSLCYQSIESIFKISNSLVEFFKKNIIPLPHDH